MVVVAFLALATLMAVLFVYEGVAVGLEDFHALGTCLALASLTAWFVIIFHG